MQRIQLKAWERPSRRGGEAPRTSPDNCAPSCSPLHWPLRTWRGCFITMPRADLCRGITASGRSDKQSEIAWGGGGRREVTIVGDFMFQWLEHEPQWFFSICWCSPFPLSHPTSSDLVSCPQNSRIWACERHHFVLYSMNLELKSGTTLEHRGTEQKKAWFLPSGNQGFTWRGKKRSHTLPPPCSPLPKINNLSICDLCSRAPWGRQTNSTWGVQRKLLGGE